jgi:hypothetical protein
MNITFSATLAETKAETAAALSASSNPSFMIIDMGASCYFTSERHLLKNFKDAATEDITVADGHCFRATGRGDLDVTFPNGSTTTPVTLKGVLYSDTMPTTLVSVGKLDESGCEL